MNDKSIFKKYQPPYDEQYTTIPNRLIVDKNLTDADFRILTYLFSNSGDWTVYLGYTRHILGWGKEKMQKTIAHVIKLGYVRREQVRVKGRFSHYNFTYHHTPIFTEVTEDSNVTKPKIKIISPQTEKPSPVKSSPVNQPLPMPKKPMPNLQALEGNASLSREIGDGNATVIPSITRKH